MEDYMIGLFVPAEYGSDDEDTQICTMTIPVPEDVDPEEFIDCFLDNALSYDLYQVMEWDFL